MKYRHKEYTIEPSGPAPAEVARVESILHRLVADTISEGYAAGEGMPAIRTAAQEIVGGAHLPKFPATIAQIRAFDATKATTCTCGHAGLDHSWPNLGRCYGRGNCKCREFKPKGST